MFWKKENSAEKKLKQMNELLKKSFANVKRDTSNIFQWLNYLYKKNLELEQAIKSQQIELSYMPRTREDIRRIVDDYYSFENLMARIRDLDNKVEEIAAAQYRHLPQQIISSPQVDLSYIEKRIEKLEQKKVTLKEKIMKRLTRNSKEYVKGIILSYIKKYGKISALQLKEIVVDEQTFCSKSSFYRLLEEVEAQEDIGVIKEGKQKHYFTKVVKQL